MQELSQTEHNTNGNTSLTSDYLEILNHFNEFFEQGSLRLNAVKILTVNHNDVIDKALLTLTSNNFSDHERLIYNICDISLRCITYALLIGDNTLLDQVQSDLRFLKDRYLSLGGTNSFIIAALRQMNIFITPLINNPEFNAEIDSYFEYVITRLDNQDHATILEKQHQGLARLKEEWLLGDADEQTETWNYLRDVLRPDSPSYSPVII